MSTTTAPVKTTPKARVITTKPRFSDKVFRAIVSVGGLSSLAILALIAFFLVFNGFSVFKSEGLSFFTGFDWIDAQLNVLGEGVDLVIKCEQSKLDGMDEFVKNMHASSGLIAQIPNGTTLAAADDAIITYLKKYAPTEGKSPLAGNSVYVDRAFIARDLPKLNAYLHYRTIDVSTIKELARRWHPKTYFAAPAKDGNHRALGDIRDSIAELDYYRSAIFIP